MKFTLNILEKRTGEHDKHWPGYVLGGRIRTSTLLLIVAFLALWWVYADHQESESSTKVTVTSVPPAPSGYTSGPKGYTIDPNYTVMPRTTSQTPTTTTPPTTTPVTTTTTPGLPTFTLPTLPCFPPLCTPTSTTPAPSQQTQPGTTPVPTSTAPGR